MFKKFSAFDQIPKEQQANALELKDGSFALSEEVDTSKLENTLTKVRKERDDALELVRTEKEKGAETQRKLDLKEVAGGDTDAKLTARMVEWKKEQDAIKTAEMAPLLAKIATLEGRTTTFDRDDKLKAAFIDAGGNAEKLAPMLRYAKEDWHLVDGRLVRKDGDGNIMSTSLKEYFDVDYKAVQAENYKGTAAEGGGAGGFKNLPAGDKSAKPETPITKWTPDQRQSFKDANGGGTEGQKAYDAAMTQHMRDSINHPTKAAA